MPNPFRQPKPISRYVDPYIRGQAMDRSPGAYDDPRLRPPACKPSPLPNMPPQPANKYGDPRLRPPIQPKYADLMPDMPGPEKAPLQPAPRRPEKAPLQPAPRRPPGNLPTGYSRFLRQLQAQAETPGGR